MLMRILTYPLRRLLRFTMGCMYDMCLNVMSITIHRRTFLLVRVYPSSNKKKTNLYQSTNDTRNFSDPPLTSRKDIKEGVPPPEDQSSVLTGGVGGTSYKSGSVHSGSWLSSVQSNVRASGTAVGKVTSSPLQVV